jgi:hypothetical protein
LPHKSPSFKRRGQGGGHVYFSHLSIAPLIPL